MSAAQALEMIYRRRGERQAEFAGRSPSADLERSATAASSMLSAATATMPFTFLGLHVTERIVRRKQDTGGRLL